MSDYQELLSYVKQLERRLAKLERQEFNVAGGDHGTLSGLDDDDHSGYALLAGRSGGQTLNGGTAANDDLVIEGTSHATKSSSYIILQPTGGKVGVLRTPTTDTFEVGGTAGLYITNAVNFSSGLNVYKRGATGDATAAIASGAEMGYHSFYGWDGAAYARGALSLVKTTEAWSSTAHGAAYAIYTTANGSTTNSQRLTVNHDGNVGVGVASPGGKLDIQQTSTTAAIPTMALTQSDVSEEFIEFDGTVAAGNPIDTAAIGTYYGKIRVSVNGTFKYLPIYNS